MVGRVDTSEVRSVMLLLNSSRMRRTIREEQRIRLYNAGAIVVDTQSTFSGRLRPRRCLAIDELRGMEQGSERGGLGVLHLDIGSDSVL